MNPAMTVTGLVPLLPEIVLGVGAMALLMLGVYRSSERSVVLIDAASIALLVIAGVIVLLLPEGKIVTFGGSFVVDGFARFLKILAILGSAAAILMSIDYDKREGQQRFEYSVLIVLSTLGMLMLISAADLIALYLGLELMSLPLYVVAASHRTSLRSTEAGLKYFVLGALSSGMLLYGASMVYGFASTTGFDNLAKLFAEGDNAGIGLVTGIVLIAVGIAFKCSAVPFHMWTPDVYEGAPTPVTAFFAVAPKIAAIVLFVRVMTGPFGGLLHEWRQIIWAISAASMILGALAAINQRNIKRLMAYSSIGHAGYALIGLAAGTAIGVRGVLVYLAVYLVMSIGTFAVILCMRRGGKAVEGIEDLAGLSRTHPALAGFFAKLYVFLAAIDAGLYSLAVLGVLASVVGAYYYLRIVKLMYFDEAKGKFDLPFGGEVQAVMLLAALVTFFFFAWPDPLVNAADTVAAALFSG